MQKNFVTKNAFTLAEVLITLSVIGVVAAMTIPVLTANYQKQVNEVKLKKAYTTWNQAAQLKMANEDASFTAGWYHSLDYKSAPDKDGYNARVSKYFKTTKIIPRNAADWAPFTLANGTTEVLGCCL